MFTDAVSILTHPCKFVTIPLIGGIFMSEKHTPKFLQNLFSHLPHIGMRKVKSLLAIFLGFWLWQAVRIFFPELEVHPLYIYIYGVIEIRNSSEKTKELGIARIKCTFTAIATGLTFLALSSFLQGLTPYSWLQLAIDLTLLVIGVLVTLIIAEKVGCNTFCGLAAAIFIIFMVYHNDEERYIYSILRALQTIMGVFVAWLINVKWFPYSEKKEST